MFLPILNFEPKWRFCKGYRLCMVANFGLFWKVFIWRGLGVFWPGFFAQNKLNALLELFFRMFLTILIFEPRGRFCKGYSLCMVASFGFFWKCCHFSNIWRFFGALFCTQQLECASRVVFRMFLTILNFERKWRFGKGYSLCMVANFGHFGNVFIFRILGLFWRFFCTQQLECASRVIFRMFLTIVTFEPKLRFWKGYSLCMVANFGHFGNILIFQSFRGILERLFAHNNCNVLLDLFFEFFWRF